MFLKSVKPILKLYWRNDIDYIDLFYLCWLLKEFTSCTGVLIVNLLWASKYQQENFLLFKISIAIYIRIHTIYQDLFWTLAAWTRFLRSKGHWLLAPPKQMPFLTISNENIFRKTQDTRLSAIVAPNKDVLNRFWYRCHLKYKT